MAFNRFKSIETAWPPLPVLRKYNYSVKSKAGMAKSPALVALLAGALFLPKGFATDIETILSIAYDAGSSNWMWLLILWFPSYLYDL